MIHFHIQYDHETDEVVVHFFDSFWFIYSDGQNFSEDGEGFGLE